MQDAYTLEAKAKRRRARKKAVQRALVGYTFLTPASAIMIFLSLSRWPWRFTSASLSGI